MQLPPPTPIHKTHYCPKSSKATSDSPGSCSPTLLCPGGNSCTAPWASDKRPREMTALLVISASGHSHYICWPAGLCARQSSGPRMGRSRGGLVLPGLRENTSTKSLTHPPNSPLSRYITSEVRMSQSSFFWTLALDVYTVVLAALPLLSYHLSCYITSYSPG